MKRIIVTLLIFFVLVITSTAQTVPCDDYAFDKKKAGNYLLNLGGCSDSLAVYLYTKQNKAVTGVTIDGKVDFYYYDDGCFTVAMKQEEKSNVFKARIPYMGFYNFKVTLTVMDETVSAYFDNTCDLRAGR